MTILIKNGLIIDGTGSKRYQSDILIKDEKIAKIGKKLEANGSKIIDASNRIIAPGFIDMHNHSDLTLFQSTKIEPYILQGVTTLVIGMCGLGIAPANEKVVEYYFDFLNKAFISTGMVFETLQDYFDEIEKRGGISANLAFFIPQGNVRACVLGSEERPATEKELNEMKEIVRVNMEAGAFGLSTGLVYPPGSVTPTEELIELSKVVSEYDGIYDSHMRNEGTFVIDVGMSELVRIAREANVKAHISHWSVIARKDLKKQTAKVIEYMKKAQDEGLKISADVTVYPDGSTSLSFILLPTWVFENFKDNLTNEDTRKKIADQVFQKVHSFFLPGEPDESKRTALYEGLSKSTEIISATHSTQIEGLPIYDALHKLYPNKNIEDALLDFIRDEDGGIMIRVQTKDEKKSVIPIFKQEYVCPSSDGFLEMKKNTHPRSYGAFARVLQRWVREMNIVSLEEAIRKMTSLPASILSLSDRGLIKEGYKADIVIFDPDTIEEKGTIANGRQHPVGIDYVIVNGALTAEKGKHTGALRGKILKNKK
ncbi:MAG: D-aminoacylase [Promethearchaeota archaeon]|nr:MAG: D-aminoacylase [Candidatus Lokiarchaeota archaeon]